MQEVLAVFYVTRCVKSCMQSYSHTPVHTDCRIENTVQAMESDWSLKADN